jgi:phosphoribosylaminoimidazole carboxylase (NCAIR synthetase)
MLKSKRLAYDGRGNAVAKSEDELSSAVNGEMFNTEAQLLRKFGIQFRLEKCYTCIHMC